MKNNTELRNIWEVNNLLNEPLSINDPRYVQTGKGRDLSHNRFLKILKTNEYNYIVLYGHRGCGKSTELKGISEYLHKDNLFFVVHLDIIEFNYYTDTLKSIIRSLLVQLSDAGINDDWLTNVIGSREKIVVASSFSEFAVAFNTLLISVEDALRKSGKTGKLLFVVDGTDKLGDSDSKRFINNADKLRLINSNFIFCLPTSLIYHRLPQMFTQLALPMIKLNEKGETKPFEDGYEVMREMIYKRADLKLFDSKDTVDYIIKYSGGSPKELLKILHYTFLAAEEDIFDIKAASKAVNTLATEYRRFLERDDYKLLYNIDNGDDPNDENTRKLLNNLALLEYDEDYWRQSHPVIRILDEYKRCAHK